MTLDEHQHKPDIGLVVSDIIADGMIGEVHTDGEIIQEIRMALLERGYEV